MIEHLSVENLISISTLVFSAFTAYNNQKMKLEIISLKLWIVQNFQEKDTHKPDKEYR